MNLGELLIILIFALWQAAGCPALRPY